ncbi:hypothetical protein [Mariprofundus ferrooxydans]|uniref:hypothetical protein n=1 Tax=Mariprofundus ferrooxydans TaxID=314344 RepID=UPI0009D6ACDF
MNTALLYWGLLFGSIGIGFFIFGKRQGKIVPLACGLILMIFPYFISNTYLLVGIGSALVALPYFIRS